MEVWETTKRVHDRKAESCRWVRPGCIGLDINVPFDLTDDERNGAQVDEPSVEADEVAAPEQPEQQPGNVEMHTDEPESGATTRDPPAAQARPPKRMRISKANGPM